MANCHSKSKVPVALLNEPAALRRMMQIAATTDLRRLHARQRGRDARAPRSRPGASPGSRLPTGPGRALVDDVIDTLRVLRCADALRQRGTVLKTSGNYEVFVDRRSANAVFAFAPTPGNSTFSSFRSRSPPARPTWRAASSIADGNLRISFHRGMFRDEETVRGRRGARR